MLVVCSGTNVDVISVVDAVEKAAGLTIFSDDIKNNSRHLCQATSCDVLVKRFDDAQQATKRQRKTIGQ